MQDKFPKAEELSEKAFAIPPHYTIVFFNGRYSQSGRDLVMYASTCLNPYFNGRYSQRDQSGRVVKTGTVLILILMEDTLRERMYTIQQNLCSLNPYFNGRYSQRTSKIRVHVNYLMVLILILMEDTLRVSFVGIEPTISLSS